jgi:hypothetical protein
MTNCTCDTHSASSNATVLTVDQTYASSTATQVIYAHSANGNMPYVLFTEGGATGVLGKVYGSNGVGLHGQTAGNGASGYGVWGESTSNNLYGYGVYGTSPTNGGGAGVYGSGWAGLYGVGGTYGMYCVGAAYVSGNLNKAGGGFKVDHPIDPANKFLIHGFVESPKMSNIYRGKVTLDANGAAEVVLPSYYSAANENGDATLTPVGTAMPNLAVSEVANGKFIVSGGVAGEKVNWTVIADRADPWVKANHPGVEVDKKADEKGLFIHPELHGFGADKHIHVNKGMGK